MDDDKLRKSMKEIFLELNALPEEELKRLMEEAKNSEKYPAIAKLLEVHDE